MSQFVQLSRQAVFNRNKEIEAYELFHFDDKSLAQNTNTTSATAKVLSIMLNQIGMQNCIGSHKAFINIDASFLLTNIFNILPKERFVFEIPSSIVLTNKETENIKDLHSKGYVFAISGVILSDQFMEKFSKILPCITYLKLDASKNYFTYLNDNIELLRRVYRLVAEKIDSANLFKAYYDLGFHYFQGYHLHKPALLKQHRLDPKHVGVARIFRMLQSQDTPIDKVAVEFERHNELSIQLLNYLVSTEIYSIPNVDSIRDVVNWMGKDRLMGWLMLSVYSKSSHTIAAEKSRLSIFLSRRIDIMNAIIENAAHSDKEKVRRQVQFMALLTVLKDIYGLTFDDLLGAFEFDKTVIRSVVTGKGVLAHVYKITKIIEKNDFDMAEINKMLQPYYTDITSIFEKLKKSR
jgi:EAL and modified HD-GYP domain-containing signal transduction protein